MNTTKTHSTEEIELKDLEASLLAEREQSHSLRDRATKLGIHLRNAGSVMLVLSALAFMLQKWGVIDHITRYFSFLGFTGMMTVAALVCGLGVKEGKGARTLFALVVALTPVHFAQLGGLIFSVFGDIPIGTQYPEYLHWQGESTFIVVSTVGAALVCLTPILLLAFSTLDRGIASLLTAGALVANSSLLIPVRDPNLVGCIAGATFLGVLLYTSRTKSLSKFATKESAAARATLFLPVAVLIGRQLTLYSLSTGFLSIALLAASGIMFFSLPRYVGPRFGGFIQVLSAVPLLIGWGLGLVAMEIGTEFHDASIFLLALGVPVAITLFALSTVSRHGGRALQIVSALLGLFTTTLAFNMHPGVTTSSLSILSVIAFIAVAFIVESRCILILSLLASAYTTLCHARVILHSFDFNLWITLGVAGVSTIVLASIVERHLNTIATYLTAARASVGGWKRY